jgi:hypothetical protein
MAASLEYKWKPPYQVPSVDITPDPPIFSLVTTFKWFKNWSNFDQMREKTSFLQRGRFFWSVAEYFSQSGWIILEKRVGNTEMYTTIRHDRSHDWQAEASSLGKREASQHTLFCGSCEKTKLKFFTRQPFQILVDKGLRLQKKTTISTVDNNTILVQKEYHISVPKNKLFRSYITL